MSYHVARIDDRRLPGAIRVGCFILAKCPGAPIYIKTLNANACLCIALTDDRMQWIGFAAVRPVNDKGEAIPDLDAKGMLAWVKTEDLHSCAAHFAAKIDEGFSAQGSKGYKAVQKMRGKKVF